MAAGPRTAPTPKPAEAGLAAGDRAPAADPHRRNPGCRAGRLPPGTGYVLGRRGPSARGAARGQGAEPRPGPVPGLPLLPDDADDPDAKRAELVANFQKLIDPYVPAGNAMIDDIIDPRETRPTVIRGLHMAASKRVARPKKRHGVMPV